MTDPFKRIRCKKCGHVHFFHHPCRETEEHSEGPGKPDWPFDRWREDEDE